MTFVDTLKKKLKDPFTILWGIIFIFVSFGIISQLISSKPANRNRFPANYEDVISNLKNNQDKDFTSSDLRDAVKNSFIYDKGLANAELKDLLKSIILKNQNSAGFTELFLSTKQRMANFLCNIDPSISYKIFTENIKIQSLLPICEIVNLLDKSYAVKLLNEYPILIDSLRYYLVKTYSNDTSLYGELSLQKGIDVLYSANQLSLNNYDKITKYLSSQETLKDLNNRLTTNEAEIKTVVFNSFAQYMQQNKIINLSFIVIGKRDDNEYEIQPENSSKRAILITRETEFQSRGYSTCRVIVTGSRKVTLRKELGSFDQEWPEYTEIKRSENDMINKKSKDIELERASLHDEIIQLKTKIATTEKYIANIKSNFKSLLFNK